MVRIPVHPVDSAPENSSKELGALKGQFGKVLNIHGAMAHSPVVLRSYVALEQVIGDYGTFDARMREATALAIGNVDQCSYRQSAHTLSAKAASDVGNVDDATWKAGLDAGWTDEELTELSIHISLNPFTNYFSHMVQTDLALPAAPGL